VHPTTSWSVPEKLCNSSGTSALTPCSRLPPGLRPRA